MDHYPYPKEPVYPPLKVPYLPYDYPVGYNGDCSTSFSTFPSRNGWEKRDFLCGDLRSGLPPETASAFLQAWLFFGLASCVLGLPPQSERFFVTKDEEGKSIVSTKALPGLIKTWMDTVHDYDEAKAKVTIDAASMALDEASVFSQAADGTEEGYRLEKLHPEIRLSIMALGDQLQIALRDLEFKLGSTKHKMVQAAKSTFGSSSWIGKAASKVDKVKSIVPGTLRAGWRHPYCDTIENSTLHYSDLEEPLVSRPEDRYVRTLLGPWHWGTSELLRRRMLDAGWCEYEAARLQDILSPWAVHYSSALPRQILFEHAKCTQLHCGAHTIDESTYSTQHVKTDCTCEFLKIDEDEVKRILEEGGIPVFRYSEDPKTHEISTMVKDQRKISDHNGFTAVSHVWSHGLGNATSNALPKCQMLRLLEICGRDLLHSERIASWLWLDTFCVPLETKYRKLAISRLSDTYFESWQKLVIDKELLAFKGKDMVEEEAVLRVICSSWMQRMWTMQEGAAQDKSHIAMSDGLIDLRAAHRRFQLDHPHWPMGKGGDASNMVTQMLWATDCPVQFDRKLKGLEPLDVQCMRIWNGMRWRQATKPGDEALIIASMLFPQTSSTFMGSYETQSDTLSKVLHADSEKRWEVLYQSHATWPRGILFVNCRTLLEKPMRWAPREVGTFGREITDATPCVVTPRGLVVQCPGYVLLTLKTQLNHCFEFLDVATGDWYVVTAMDEGDIRAWPSPGTASFAVVQSRRQAGYSKIPAVLGIVEELVDGTLYMEFACKVHLAKVFPERKAEMDNWLAANPECASGPHAARTARYEEDQMWCVG